MAAIQSNQAPLELSEDGTTWKVLVCLTGTGVNQTRNINRTSTYCGSSVGLGENQVTVPFDAQCETEPDTTQVTYKDMNEWMNAGTLLWWRIQDGVAGDNLYHKGEAYVTQLNLVGAADEVILFNGQLESTGPLDIDPAP